MGVFTVCTLMLGAGHPIFFQGSQCSGCLHGSKGELRGKKGGAEGSWFSRLFVYFCQQIMKLATVL